MRSDRLKTGFTVQGEVMPAVANGKAFVLCKPPKIHISQGSDYESIRAGIVTSVALGIQPWAAVIA